MVFAVLDSSFVLSWGFEETGFEEGLDIMTKVARLGGIAPALWATEVTEGLLKGVRRSRITFDEAKTLAQTVSRLRVEQDSATWDQAWARSLWLAHEHKLSVYDASYLELASRKGVALATYDGKLRKAAIAEHVLVLPLQ